MVGYLFGGNCLVLFSPRRLIIACSLSIRPPRWLKTYIRVTIFPKIFMIIWQTYNIYVCFQYCGKGWTCSKPFDLSRSPAWWSENQRSISLSEIYRSSQRQTKMFKQGKIFFHLSFDFQINRSSCHLASYTRKRWH